MGTKPDTKSTEKPDLSITRVFDAPRDMMFKAWTDATELAEWWGPRGFTVPFCDSDPRPGGNLRIDMQGPDGMVHTMTGVYHQVDAPERLVSTSYVRDAAGKTLIEVFNTVDFAPVSDDLTELSLACNVIELAPEFAAARAGMDEGWKQSLDCLAEYLAARPAA